MTPVHPWELLEKCTKHLEWNKKEIAEIIWISASIFSRLCKKKDWCSRATAQKLFEFSGIPVDEWRARNEAQICTHKNRSYKMKKYIWITYKSILEQDAKRQVGNKELSKQEAEKEIKINLENFRKNSLIK